VDLEAVGVVLGQVGLDPTDELRVVGAVGFQPEHRRYPCRARARDRQLYPVANRGVLDLARPPDVPRLDDVLEQRVSGGIHHPDGAVVGDLEGLVV